MKKQPSARSPAKKLLVARRLNVGFKQNNPLSRRCRQLPLLRGAYHALRDNANQSRFNATTRENLNHRQLYTVIISAEAIQAPPFLKGELAALAV